MSSHVPLCLGLQLIGWLALALWWLHREGAVGRLAVFTLAISAISLAWLILGLHPGKDDGAISAGFSLACWTVIAFRLVDPEPMTEATS